MGRGRGLDKTTTNKIIASLAFLVGAMGLTVFGEFPDRLGETSERARFKANYNLKKTLQLSELLKKEEVQNLFEKYLRLTTEPKIWEVENLVEKLQRKRDILKKYEIKFLERLKEADRSSVPETELKEFVKTFFGIDRKTFYDHIEEKIVGGKIAEEHRLHTKGQKNYYVLKKRDVRPFFIYPKKDKTMLKSRSELEELFLQKNKFYLSNPKFCEKLEGILEELEIKIDSKEEDPSLRVQKIFQEYPTIEKAFQFYTTECYHGTLTSAVPIRKELEKKEFETLVLQLKKRNMKEEDKDRLFRKMNLRGEYVEEEKNYLIRAYRTGKINELKKELLNERQRKALENQRRKLHFKFFSELISEMYVKALENMLQELIMKIICPKCLIKPLSYDRELYLQKILEPYVVYGLENIEKSTKNIDAGLLQYYENPVVRLSKLGEEHRGCPVCHFRTSIDNVNEVMEMPKRGAEPKYLSRAKMAKKTWFQKPKGLGSFSKEEERLLRSFDKFFTK